MTRAERRRGRQIHLAASIPGASLDVASIVSLARAAERGLFDFLVLSGPATLTVLSALAAVSDRLGLVGAVHDVGAALDRPVELARQLATLDHLSSGRSGWSVVAAPDGDDVPRAEEFLVVARAFWDGWEPGAVRADDATGRYVDPGRIHAVEFRGAQFDVRGVATLPAGPQGYPVLVQEGDSPAARGFGAEYADVVLTRHPTLEARQRYYAEVKTRAAGCGRDPLRPKVFAVMDVAPGSTTEQVAAAMELHVQSEACDGFLLEPHLTPHGLDEFVDAVVPSLQERGVFRTSYEGQTLRENLGLT